MLIDLIDYLGRFANWVMVKLAMGFYRLIETPAELTV